MNVTCTDCGLAYDDTYHRTYCPHPWFPMRTLFTGGDGKSRMCTTIAELDQAMQQSGQPQSMPS